MNDLEYSLREGLRAALLLAKRGHLRQLGKLMAASANAISWAEKAATLRANILQHELDVLRDKYEPEE